MKYNLIDIAKKLGNKFSTIESIYLFGSRIHNPSTPIKDIDLLFTIPEDLHLYLIREHIEIHYPYIDSFVYNKGETRSLTNEIILQESAEKLLLHCGMVLLWSKDKGPVSCFEHIILPVGKPELGLTLRTG